MEIQISSRHETKTSESLRETITDKMSNLEKFSDKITSCHVVLDTESLNKVVEIVLHVHEHTVKGLAKAENVGKALDEAVGKVERQLVKINEKIKDHKAEKLHIEE